MKKRVILYNIFLTIIIIMICGGTVLAVDEMTMQILGKKYENVPFIIDDGEILAPARNVVEGFEGEVEWYGLLKVLNCKFDQEYQIRMQVDNQIVTINPGKQDSRGGTYNKKLTVSPKIIEGQTMVPLSFFAEHFGYLLKWDEKKKLATVYKPTNWVQSVNFEEGLEGERLVIASTKKIPYKTYILAEPDRLVIDLQQSVLSANAIDITEKSYIFKSVRLAQNDTETVRVVMEFNHLVKYQIKEEMGSDGFKLIVAFAPGIRQVTLNEQGISIKSSGKIGEFNTLELKDRLVIDISDQTLQLSQNKITFDHEQIYQVRASQLTWEPQVVRLVMDLKEKIEYKIHKTSQEIVVNVKKPGAIEESDSKVPESPDNEPVKNNGVDIVLVDVGEEYKDQEVISIGIKEGINQRIVIQTSTPITSKIWYLPNPDRLVVDLKGALCNLQNDQIAGKQGNIKNVRMHQYPDKVRIVFDLSEYISHQVLSNERTSKVEIGLGKPVQETPLSGKLIVIDPGHGGSDPGAISQSGLFEKEITLKIGIKVKELLKNAGATVIMTRDKDVYPTLGERVDLANQLNSDIFISIHCNSFGGNDPGGTETFISFTRQEESKQLAQVLQTNLVKQIQLYDRGVKSNDFFVLNHTTMPAALIEVAFISKKDEEALLVDDAFQQKAALGIYQGILEYFMHTSKSGETQ